LFTRIDRWEKYYRALSVEAYHLNMNDTHEAHWRELIADVPPELGRTWSRYWDASNAELLTIDLSTSTSENQSNEQNPDAMMTPVWQENPTWAGQNFVSGMTKLADHSYLSTTGDRTDRGPKSIQSGDILCIIYSGGPVFALRCEHGRNFATKSLAVINLATQVRTRSRNQDLLNAACSLEQSGTWLCMKLSESVKHSRLMKELVKTKTRKHTSSIKVFPNPRYACSQRSFPRSLITHSQPGI
jgi:hypothetical protein